MSSANGTPAPTSPPTFSIVVGPGHVDHSANGPTAQAALFGFEVAKVTELRLAHLAGDLDDAQLDRLVSTLLVDPVGQWWRHAGEHLAEIADPSDPDADRVPRVVEIGLRPGVTDREAAELIRAAGELGIPVGSASIGRRLLIEGDLSDTDLARLVDQVLHNEVVERWADGLLQPAFTDPDAKAPGIDVVAVRAMDADELTALSRSRRLGLSTDEMVVIRDHFADQDRDPTDGELETLAQTWSEHCSHKTFRASITVDGEAEPIDGLLKTYLRAATDAIDAPWVTSAFVDNAGIVAFDDTHEIAIKAETHNHPSALEPFGGANTGVGGVVRDIIGVSARPIAITDVLCFGPEDLPVAELPDGVLHPRRIRDGVIAGVGDYGNKIGVPNLAGAILHDPSFTTTPLVFAGCVGILPRGTHRVTPLVGDSIVVLGGAVGRDGVGGATFSSQTMGVETADIAGSSVQIGDPVVEKGLIDVVVEARDRALYTAITDCGAGGLSSAVGEMAQTLGATVDLGQVPRKYPGLAPWETWLSEAQERMVLAATDPAPLLELAARWQVDAAVIGTFTGTGRLVVTEGGATVVDLDTGFLHDGRPRLSLRAAAVDTARPPRDDTPVADRVEALLRLLAHPSLRSNEAVVRTYDHEILAGTLVRPYGGLGADAPADGTAMIPPGTDGTTALAIGIGVNVVIGRHDTEAMAWAAVDEAVRNAVVAGADPSRLSLLDNFAWGNPTDPEALGDLVAACRGCHDAAIAHGAPFVSGKDSLYNEFVRPDGTRDPVTPTLVITALGLVPDPDSVPLTGVVSAGDDVWLVGPARGELGGGHLDDVLGADRGGPVPAPDPAAVERHRQVHAAITAGLVRSLHDLAEGGLVVAAAEWALGGRLGLDLDPSAAAGGDVDDAVLFGEGAGRYLVEVDPADAERFAGLVPGAVRIGAVTGGSEVTVGDLTVGLDRIERAFAGHAATAPAVTPEPTWSRAGRAPTGAPAAGGSRPRVLIPIAPGTNRNQELADAFAAVGADATQVPLTALRSGEVRLADHQILAIPGGFSYGDALGAGRLLGLDLAGWFGDQLRAAVDRHIPVIGICNGFQALVRAGLLPGDGSAAALVANESHRFECRWVTLVPEPGDSVWLSGIDEPLRCPVAHGEGRLVVDDPALVAPDAGPVVGRAGVAFRYAAPDGSPAAGAHPYNPNGSVADVAGLVDATGLVLGLMPHPEDHLTDRNDPLRGRVLGGSCRPLFAAGVTAVTG